MAITYTQLAASSSTTDASSYSTASITPTADTLVCACIIVADDLGSSVPAPTSVVGCGITWTEIVSLASLTFHASAWYGWSASPTTDTIDFTWAASRDGAHWWVFELPGAELEAPVRTATDTGTTALAMDVGTADATSALFGGGGKSVSSGTLGAWTPGTDYTEVGDATIATNRRSFWEYDITAPTDGVVDATNSGGTGPQVMGIAWECQEATAPPPSDPEASVARRLMLMGCGALANMARLAVPLAPKPVLLGDGPVLLEAAR